mmetsp:Transcript_5665/g.8440  ORF Transcript_5665/g.8440 Transcript_5665/m.8440 type:complete len:129 (-) Transcript_5665:234-620(-)
MSRKIDASPLQNLIDFVLRWDPSRFSSFDLSIYTKLFPSRFSSALFELGMLTVILIDGIDIYGFGKDHEKLSGIVACSVGDAVVRCANGVNPIFGFFAFHSCKSLVGQVIECFLKEVKINSLTLGLPN